MKAIEVDGLTKFFKSKTKRVQALSGMSFDVNEGEIFGFLGPNGAGKSTTIKILVDLIRADNGAARIFGIDSRNYKARQNIGFMPENPQYYDTLTGLDLLMLSAAMYQMPKKEALDRAWQLLEEFELKDAAKRQIRKYSKGMIQRIGFTAALIHRPRLLILDEPMSGLDPIGRVLFKRKMEELKNEGVTIFFSSHIIPDIEDVCDRVLIVKDGKNVRELTKREIKYLYTKGYKIILRAMSKPEPNAKHLENDLYAIEVKKDRLKEALERLANENIEVVDIEPERKTLEDMFIEIVENLN